MSVSTATSKGANNAACRAFAFIACLSISTVSSASEKLFLAQTRTCYFAGGQVWTTENTETYYSEVIGSTNGMSAQICGKSFFDSRACATVTLYNFRLA